jgi:hypothetical protein
MDSFNWAFEVRAPLAEADNKLVSNPYLTNFIQENKNPGKQKLHNSPPQRLYTRLTYSPTTAPIPTTLPTSAIPYSSVPTTPSRSAPPKSTCSERT